MQQMTAILLLDKQQKQKMLKRLKRRLRNKIILKQVKLEKLRMQRRK